MRRIAVPLLAAALAAGLVAPRAASAEPHVLVYADGADLTSLDALQPQAAPNNELNYLTMAYLTRYTTGGLQPELAVAVPTERNGGISADGRSITFHLRPGLKWSDGEPLTSADVAYTVALIEKPATNTLYRDDYKKIVRVDTPNPTTVVFRLARPDGNALDDLLGSRSAPILPKHLLAGVDVNTAPLWSKPVGAGPFRFVSWSRGDSVVLEANPNYALGQPKLTRIVYKMIPTESTAINAVRTGEVSYLLLQTYADYAPIKDVPGVHAAVSLGVRPSYLGFNAQNAILRDPVVRRALRLATDRASLLKRAFLGGGVLSETVLSPGDPARASIPLVPFDPAEAGKMLDEEGWKLGSDGVRVKDGQRLSVQLIGGAGATFVDQILELVRLQWARAGVEVETKRYQLSMMFAQDGILYGGKYAVGLFSGGQTRVSQFEDSYSCATISPNGGNLWRLCDTTLDAKLAKAKQTYDPSVSIPLYVDIQRRVFNDAPYMIIALRNEYNIYRDGVVSADVPPFAFFADPMKIDVTK